MFKTDGFYRGTKTAKMEPDCRNRSVLVLLDDGLDNERPNMGIGGITPAMKLKMAA